MSAENKHLSLSLHIFQADRTNRLAEEPDVQSACQALIDSIVDKCSQGSPSQDASKLRKELERLKAERDNLQQQLREEKEAKSAASERLEECQKSLASMEVKIAGYERASLSRATAEKRLEDKVIHLRQKRDALEEELRDSEHSRRTLQDELEQSKLQTLQYREEADKVKSELKACKTQMTQCKSDGELARIQMEEGAKVKDVQLEQAREKIAVLRNTIDDYRRMVET